MYFSDLQKSSMSYKVIAKQYLYASFRLCREQKALLNAARRGSGCFFKSEKLVLLVAVCLRVGLVDQWFHTVHLLQWLGTSLRLC